MPSAQPANPLATSGRSGNSPAIVAPQLLRTYMQETYPRPQAIDFSRLSVLRASGAATRCKIFRQ